MKKLIFVTKNKGKFWSAKNQLEEYGIEVLQKESDLPEPRSYDLREIAKQKALYAFSLFKKSLMVTDAGFYMNDYENFPGPFTNFILQTIGIEGILKLVKESNRKAKFTNVLAYIKPGLKEPVIFENSVNVIIADKPRGNLDNTAWSELFLIVIPPGHEITLAQMNRKDYINYWKGKVEKDSCFKQFGNWLKNR